MEAPAKTAPPLIAVVVVTYNGSPWIDRCLQSIASQAIPTLTIVVDNASTDDTCARIQAGGHDVTLIPSAKNLGFGVGNNLGIRRALDAGAEFIFLLNQDAYLCEGCLPDLVAFMAETPAVGIAAPLHCSPDPEHVDRRTFRGYLQCHAEDYLCDAVFNRQQLSYSVHGVNAAGWCVRASVFQTFGGFDPLFFMYGEDDDLLARWAFHRVRFELLPGARMVHLRQSPPGPKAGYGRRLWLGSERRRSELLKTIKHPGYRLPHMLAVLLAKGFIVPLADALVLRRWTELLAAQLGAVRVALQIKQVLAHARLTAQQGEHFLQETTTP